jgi:hypothetical protein
LYIAVQWCSVHSRLLSNLICVGFKRLFHYSHNNRICELFCHIQTKFVIFIWFNLNKWFITWWRCWFLSSINPWFLIIWLTFLYFFTLVHFNILKICKVLIASIICIIRFAKIRVWNCFWRTFSLNIFRWIRGLSLNTFRDYRCIKVVPFCHIRIFVYLGYFNLKSRILSGKFNIDLSLFCMKIWHTHFLGYCLFFNCSRTWFFKLLLQFLLSEKRLFCILLSLLGVILNLSSFFLNISFKYRIILLKARRFHVIFH